MKSLLTRHRTWLVLVALLMAAMQANAGSHLVATLTDSAPKGSDALLVTLTLRNDGDEPVHVFKYATPFVQTGDGLGNDLFEVTDSFGRRAPYRGGNVYSGPPTLSQFELLEPGQYLEKQMDLSREYDYGGRGPVSIRYVLRMHHEPEIRLSTAEELEAFRFGDQAVVESNTLSVWAPPYRQRVAEASKARRR